MKILILGTPKSGTTALFDRVSATFPEAFKVFEPRFLGGFEKDHAAVVCKYLRLFDYSGGAEAYDKIVLLFRNRFDVLISHAFFAPASGGGFTDNGAVETYLKAVEALCDGRADFVDLIALLSDIRRQDYLSYLTEQAKALIRVRESLPPEKSLVFRYEDLMSGRLDDLEAFLGRPLRQAPSALGWTGFIKRSEEAENWPRCFSRRDFDTFAPVFADFHESFGYRADPERLGRRRISREESSGYLLRVLNRYRKMQALPAFERGAEAFKGGRDFDEARFLLEEGADLRKALRLSEAAIALQPAISGYRRLKVQILLASGREEDAIDFAEASLGLDPPDADLHVLLRDAAERRGDQAGVIRYQRLLADATGEEAPRRRLIGLLLQAGQSEEALSLAARWVEAQPERAGYWQSYAVALLRKGRQQEAVTVAQRALELDPTLPGCRRVLARALAAGGRFSEALAAAETCAERDPDRKPSEGELALWRRSAVAQNRQPGKG